jgi:hypothetical protein
VLADTLQQRPARGSDHDAHPVPDIAHHWSDPAAGQARRTAAACAAAVERPAACARSPVTASAAAHAEEPLVEHPLSD